MDTFKTSVLHYFAGMPVDLVETAISGLKNNLESASLLILAGLSDADHQEEKSKYFLAALDELKIRQYEKREAQLELMRLMVQKILAGKTEMIPGINEIEKTILKAGDFHAESTEFLYDSIGFAKAYGLFDRYQDITADPSNMQLFYPGQNQEETAKRLLQELKTELKNWHDSNR